MFRARRDRRGPDRWLPHKTMLFLLGSALGLTGMAAERAWLVYAAVAVLAIGFALRFLPRDSGDSSG